ncbi:MAG: septum site-determining protein MinD [Lachnospiraceae bacterium]|nr:septum site-determining protein MinD [Lachnospiraceae bacterium]
MRVIVITSGKGGVGKTTTAANLGVGLAALGRSTLLVDMDMGLRNLDVALGQEDRVYYHLMDILNGVCSIQDALLSDPRYPNLRFLAASQMTREEQLPSDQVRMLMNDLAHSFDVILLDSPAGIGNGFRSAILSATEAIVVTTPTMTAVRDADRVLHLLEDAGVRDRSLLINRSRADMVAKGAMLEARDIADILGVPLVGIVPEDDQVLLSGNDGETLIGSGSLAGQAYERIARRLLGQTVPLPEKKKKRGWFFGRK